MSELDVDELRARRDEAVDQVLAVAEHVADRCIRSCGRLEPRDIADAVLLLEVCKTVRGLRRLIVAEVSG